MPACIAPEARNVDDAEGEPPFESPLAEYVREATFAGLCSTNLPV
jgi:hypothetical protein